MPHNIWKCDAIRLTVWWENKVYGFQITRDETHRPAQGKSARMPCANNPVEVLNPDRIGGSACFRTVISIC
ncbi:MAG: hypothetical protein LBR08_04495 [Bacteroidales bacterium]|nr:hypothetical protein [Bacteroidales bacterium]